MRIENFDYDYELSDQQLQYYRALPAVAKLGWLDQARRFTLLARRATARSEACQQTASYAVPAGDRRNRG